MAFQSLGQSAMSMEAALDEERKEILALLEGNQASRSRAPTSPTMRSPSPYTSPRSPPRSMLDMLGDDEIPPEGPNASSRKSPTRAPSVPVRSMLDISSPPPPVFRSMLDIESPAPVKQSFSAQGSPTETHRKAQASAHVLHPRSVSDASAKTADLAVRSGGSRLDPTTEYQFSNFFTNVGPSLPKRNTQAGRSSGSSSGAGVMADVMRGTDVASLVLPGDSARHSIAGLPNPRRSSKSKSPSSRLSIRSSSPAGALQGRHLSPAGRTVLDNGRTLDLENAYRRLSDANLALYGGSLSEFARRGRPKSTGRLEKVYMTPDGELLDSSDDEADLSTDDEDQRGRQAERKSGEPSLKVGKDSQSAGTVDEGRTRKSMSLLAAAEAERKEVASQKPYQYRSLFDEPEITVTKPSGEKTKHSKNMVIPNTSFNHSPAASDRSPMDSEDEADVAEIQRAQNLSFAMTNIMSYPDFHRTIRIIYRGDYSRIARDMEKEERRQRKYLVATDLSDESAHAMEWAVGTVLRDGDSLIAIYCVDEETGIITGDGGLVPDDEKAMKEQAAAISALTTSKAPVGPTGALLPMQKGSALHLQPSDGSSVTASPAPSSGSNERSKTEEERHRAVQRITERVNKLLRKTNLQVRVIVEVIHCKNPKHLITEVIDLVDPTLVILGSRGRSALKGVILGSFSNYLVTKSSVPVMVARKRLRKQSKYKRPSVKLVNNINNPSARSLANAKID